MKARVLLLAAVCFLAVQTQAAFDAFLKIEGVDGESVDAEFERQIDIESFSWGMSNPMVVGGGGTGRATFQDMTIMKRLDKSSPRIMLGCATGQVFPEVVISLRRGIGGARPLTYYKITMQECLISSYQSNGTGGDDRPSESISFSYAKIIVEYTPVDANGRPMDVVRFGWDLATNRPL